MTKKELLEKMNLQNKDMRFLFENPNMPEYQGMLWISFAFGTGLNHECDDAIEVLRDIIEYCMRKMSRLFGKKISRANMLKIIGHKNGDNLALLFLFCENCCKDGHALVVTPTEIFLIKNADHKVYLLLLNNGQPLVTFASSDRDGRGVFDGKHLYFGEKIRSSLPETLGLELTQDGFASKYFHGNEQLFVGLEEVKKIAQKKEQGIVIVEF